MREVHPHRRAFAQDRIGAGGGIAAGHFRTDPQRLVGRVAHPEHPLVAAHAAHAAADLVGQRLERQPLIGRGQRAGNPVARALRRLGPEKNVDRFLKPPLQQVFITFERNRRRPRAIFARSEPRGEVEAVDRVEKQQRPHPVIEVFALAAEPIERVRFRQQMG